MATYTLITNAAIARIAFEQSATMLDTDEWMRLAGNIFDHEVPAGIEWNTHTGEIIVDLDVRNLSEIDETELLNMAIMAMDCAAEIICNRG